MASLVPVYLISDALQPMAAESIRDEGGHYFSFLLVGLVAMDFVTTALNALPQALKKRIGSGTLEALIGTPVSLPALLAGFVGYPFVWTIVRTSVMVVAGALLGVDFAWTRMAAGAGVLALIVLCYFPVGLVAAASVLLFRTTTPLPTAVLLVSNFLGGVYYSTTVVPEWLEWATALVPLTYGLRVLRRSILEAAPLSGIAADLATMTGFTAVALLIGLAVFRFALARARRAGTLAHY